MRILLALLFTFLALSISAQVQTPATVCAGTKDECQQQEILVLQQQNLELQAQLANAQIRLAQLDLQAKQVKLISDVAERLHAKVEEIDPVTLAVTPKAVTGAANKEKH